MHANNHHNPPPRTGANFGFPPPPPGFVFDRFTDWPLPPVDPPDKVETRHADERTHLETLISEVEKEIGCEPGELQGTF